MLLEEYYNSGDLNEAAVSLQVGWRAVGRVDRRRATAVRSTMLLLTCVCNARMPARKDALTHAHTQRCVPTPCAICFTQELDHPEFGHYFVKRALVTAMDKHAREREMTSVLLSTLYNEVGGRTGRGQELECAVPRGAGP